MNGFLSIRSRVWFIETKGRKPPIKVTFGRYLIRPSSLILQVSTEDSDRGLGLKMREIFHNVGEFFIGS